MRAKKQDTRSKPRASGTQGSGKHAKAARPKPKTAPKGKTAARSKAASPARRTRTTRPPVPPAPAPEPQHAAIPEPRTDARAADARKPGVLARLEGLLARVTGRDVTPEDLSDGVPRDDRTHEIVTADILVQRELDAASGPTPDRRPPPPPPPRRATGR